MKYRLHLILLPFDQFDGHSPQFDRESRNWWQISHRKYLKRKRSKVPKMKLGRNLTWRSVADPTLTKTSVTPDLINPIFMSQSQSQCCAPWGDIYIEPISALSGVTDHTSSFFSNNPFLRRRGTITWVHGPHNWTVIRRRELELITSYIPRPRDATSVATRTGVRPSRNCRRTESRSPCDLSPWIALEMTKNWNLQKNLRCRPAVPSHAESQLVGAAFRLGKNDSFALTFAHNLTHQSKQFILLNKNDFST